MVAVVFDFVFANVTEEPPSSRQQSLLRIAIAHRHSQIAQIKQFCLSLARFIC
jgi:hypothetical protein